MRTIYEYIRIMRRGCTILVIALGLVPGCGSTQRDSRTGGTNPTTTNPSSSGDYLSDQATGMAAEDAARAKPATGAAKKPRRTHNPIRTQRRSPVDQPRLQR